MSKKFKDSLAAVMIFTLVMSLFSLSFVTTSLATAQSTFTASETVPNSAVGADTQAAVAATTVANITSSEAGLEAITGIVGYTVSTGAAGDIVFTHTGTAIDGNPVYEEDLDGNGTYDDVVANIANTDSVVGNAAVQSQTDITIDTAFADGHTLVIDNCTISFTDGAVVDTDCSDDAAAVDTTAAGSYDTAVEQADYLATFSGLDNYAFSNGAGAGDAVFRITHSTVAVDGNPAESSGITDADGRVTAAVVVAGEAMIQSVNTIAITGDITSGAKIRFNGVLVITFTGNTSTDTDASNDTASISPFQSAGAQVDTVTPANIEVGDVFTVTIGGTDYVATATAATVLNIVELLQPLVDADAAVTCTEDDTKITCTADTAGTAFTLTAAAVNATDIAQEVTFTPSSVVSSETFNVVINGTTYSFKATAATAQNVVEGLQPLIDANAAVTCTEDDVMVICVADVAGTAFTYSASVTEAPSSGGVITPTPLPPIVTAVNVPLTISTGQSGTMTLTFEDATMIKIEVPKGAVAGLTTFNVEMSMATGNEMPASGTVAVLVGNKIFNINARDSKHNIVKNFSGDLVVTVSLPELTTNTSGLGVYWLNEVSGLWVLVPGADFASTAGLVTFSISHLTKFAAINAINTPGLISTPGGTSVSVEEPTLISKKIYTDGTLVRTPDKRIYVIISGKLQHITTLQELIQYIGKKIINVGYGNLGGYEKIVPAAKKYADGTLLRATNKKIYVVMNGKKKQVMNLVELRAKHANKPIHNVSESILGQY
ncbi:hypothetical protein L6270_02095 [Candidatus Parcubacteria bacterium]|nr:hypothetical protein [Patescibacteria group bacterium]MBU4309447.1 hypothetical protein [Patescibacteria group bacterium]MBU4432238.1 hypothetical protein [Patescibacteria group bacterium]MBU4577808.1 hypothetical protein [Patescibacteria group bacterium]MCG2696801.1 hypothetical protein [Candidatus Parcubacteria bacterium]